MSTVLKFAFAAAAAFAVYRVVAAIHQGVSPLAALKHPTLSPRLADLAAHPERQQKREGLGHFV